MTWELREVSDVDCTMDDSGVYVVINRVVRTETHKEYSGERVLVRADLMQVYSNRINELKQNVPIVSFIGSANNVRKHLIRFIMERMIPVDQYPISHEHASYIGYELLRAETDPNYVQD